MDDGGKEGGIEARAANPRSVELGLGYQSFDISGLTAAAI